MMAGKPVFEVLLEYRGEVGMLPEVKGVYDEPLPAEVGSLIAYICSSYFCKFYPFKGR